jgi:ATP-dependent Clp protease ATP-binding subunit ClpC
VITMTSVCGGDRPDDPSAGANGGPGVEWVDLSHLMSEEARELVRRAAEQAALWGSPAVDAQHMLWAATQLPNARRLLAYIDVDADRLAERLEQGIEKATPADQAPPLGAAAQSALVTAAGLAQSAGAGTIGLEHILLGVADPNTAAGRELQKASRRGEALRRVAPPPDIPHDPDTGPVQAQPPRPSP